MNTIRTEQRTVYITSTGREFPTMREAEVETQIQEMVILLGDLPDVYWRQTNPPEVAEALHKAGYVIVHNDKDA